MRVLALLGVLGACGGDASVELVKTRSVGAPHGDVVGVDSDRAGGLWLAYRVPPVDYYAHADVRLVHVDVDGNELALFRYDDTYTQVSGLAFTGDAVWLNYNGGFTDDNRIRKLDPSTGLEIGSFATEVGIVDLCSRGESLLLSNMWNQIAAFDQTRGGEQWRATIAAYGDGGTQRGIATNDDGIWVLSQDSDSVHLVDESGTEITAGALPGYQYTLDSTTDHLTWDGDLLVVAHLNELAWFEVTR